MEVLQVYDYSELCDFEKKTLELEILRTFVVDISFNELRNEGMKEVMDENINKQLIA